MADILTLEQARAGLNWQVGQNPERDDELEALYIPATTSAVEAVCGRMADRLEWWETTAESPITTPWTSGVAVVKSGRLRLTDWSHDLGVLTITDLNYVPGSLLRIACAGLPTPAAVVLAAQIILAQAWNADHQGRTANSTVRGGADSVPITFLVPARAEKLLFPYSIVPMRTR